MVFSSLTFLLYFLPVFLIGMIVLGNTRARVPFLTAISLVFYAWGEPLFLLVMLASIAGNYLVGRRLPVAGSPRREWALLVAAMAANLATLVALKYAHFLATSLDRVWALPPSWLAVTGRIPLPIGISFFTFQAMSYLVDVHRRETPPETSLVGFAAYISLFPQLIAGPIVRYVSIREELDHPRPLTPAALGSGLREFVVGLGMKVILANPLGGVADAVFGVPPGELSSGAAWLGAVCYFGQIFFDFNGYSIMAIGLGRCCGFTFPPNFADPYRAVSVTDFWRRWHLTLSSFFRDYLYIPLGGNRRGTLRTGINLMVVFFLCGLWHGASWSFVVWGLYHGAFLFAERLRRRRTDEPSGIAGVLYTSLVVLVGWVLFRAASLAEAGSFLSAMAGLGSALRPAAEFAPPALALLLAAAALVIYVQPSLRPYWPRSAALRNGAAALTAVVSAWLLVTGTHNPFIYFRF